MPSGCYVYAILARDTPLPPGLTGLGGTPVTGVAWGQLTAAVGPVDPTELRRTPDLLLCHEMVVEVIRQCGPALPVRFGTVLADSAAVEQALAERHQVLLADLARLGNQVELGLIVLWEPFRLGRESTLAPNGEVSPPPSGSDGLGDRSPGSEAGPGPGARYLWARLKQYRCEERRRSLAEALADDLDRVLGDHALDRRHLLLATPHLALDAAYLVEPDRVMAFREAFEGARAARPDLQFLLSGPWPPYSFVTPPTAPPRLAGTTAESQGAEPGRANAASATTAESALGERRA